MFYQAVNKVLNVIAAKAIINHIETFTSADVATKTWWLRKESNINGNKRNWAISEQQNSTFYPTYQIEPHVGCQNLILLILKEKL